MQIVKTQGLDSKAFCPHLIESTLLVTRMLARASRTLAKQMLAKQIFHSQGVWKIFSREKEAARETASWLTVSRKEGYPPNGFAPTVTSTVENVQLGPV